MTRVDRRGSHLLARTCRARRATSGRTPSRLCAAHRRGDPLTRLRQPGLRRPARGRVLRRPRVHLRPRRPAPVPARLPDQGTVGDAGDQHPCRPERPQHRHPGADQGPHAPRHASRRTTRTPTRPSASGRRRAARRALSAATAASGRAVDQVSRLGMPLINEVIIPMGQKDYWNTQAPGGTLSSAASTTTRRSRGCSTCSTRAPSRKSRPTPRSLRTLVPTSTRFCSPGCPPGSSPASRTTPGATKADLLRLNLAIPPTAPVSANILGVVGGDNAGFPNGRRVFDDVVSVELKAVAGALLHDVVPSFTADAAAAALFDVGKPSRRPSWASAPVSPSRRRSPISPTRGTGWTTPRPRTSALRADGPREHDHPHGHDQTTVRSASPRGRRPAPRSSRASSSTSANTPARSC